MFVKKENSGVILAGSGRICCCLADLLCQMGEQVTIIDAACDSLCDYSPDFTGITVEGDASDIDVLRRSGISQAKAVIAATGSDHVNLMIAQIARDIYAVPFVYAVVEDSKRASAQAGFDFSILCPAEVMARTLIAALFAKEGTV